jgi:hypothetical protein
MKTTKLALRDPEAAYVRKQVAQRRVGPNAKCQCGETRPEALKRKNKRVICHECQRKELGMKTTDEHHFAMEANLPDTITVPANDHAAELNVAQYDWPKQTQQNPDGSPLIAAAGSIRGFVDTVLYLIEKGLHWVADMLEKLDTFLVEKFGAKWWVDTPLESFAPKKNGEQPS